jgi:hypothetical protein
MMLEQTIASMPGSSLIARLSRCWGNREVKEEPLFASIAIGKNDIESSVHPPKSRSLYRLRNHLLILDCALRRQGSFSSLQ